MKDRQIREMLNSTELAIYHNDGDSKVVEEFKLPVANARIDIAVFNHHLHGYEIKSASDTLNRLPSQVNAYSKVFDYLSIVTEAKYYESILKIIPEWVGVLVCSNKDNIEVIQPPIYNENKDGFFIAQLLWHSELIEVLSYLNIPHKKNARRWVLCSLLTNNIKPDELSAIARQKIKARQDWRVKEDFLIK